MITYILFCHWLNDFVGQGYLFPSLEIGKNKSKDIAILWVHILLYTAGMWLLLWPFMGMATALAFAALNGSIHLVIDYFTSKASSKAYADGNIRWFWTVIGFDQFLHVAVLCATLPV
jgi:hypothetical protein